MRRLVLALFVLLPLVAFARVGGPPVVDAGVPTDFTLSLDCDDITAGVQAACTVPQGTSLDVELVLTNNTPSAHAINFLTLDVHDPDTTRLLPPPIFCSGSCFSSNPDFHQEALAPIPGDWACNPPPPDNDTGADGPGTAVSFLSCANMVSTGPSIAPGGSIVLGMVRYGVLNNVPAGSVALSISDAFVFEDFVTELGSCGPTLTVPMTCDGATVTVAPVTMLIDCNKAQPGIQTKCYISNTLATRDMDVVVRNNSNTAFTLGTFNFDAVHLDDARLFAPSIVGGFDGNPDFTADATALGDWSCGPPNGPDNDSQLFPPDPGQRSFISCFNGIQSGPTIAASSTLAVAAMHYNIVAGADVGSMTLSLENASVFDDTFTMRGACSAAPEMPCNGAEIIFYCQIDQADVVGIDGRVNSGDLGKVASKFGQIPAPVVEDQNFDGVINSGDLGLVASVFNQYVVNCP